MLSDDFLRFWFWFGRGATLCTGKLISYVVGYSINITIINDHNE